MSAMDLFWAAPPVSRTLALGTLSLSLLVHTGFLSYYWVVFFADAFWKLPPQLWRLATCFMISGPKLGILMDPYFMYTYASRLESGSPRFSQPGDFFTYILFVSSVILGLNFFLTGAFLFTSPLILAFIYTACQDERGGKSQIIVITIPTQWMPLAMLLMTFAMEGPEATKVQVTGLVAAHLYDFVTRLWPEFGGGKNLVQTPAFIKRIFQSTEPATRNTNYGTAFTPAQRQNTVSSTGASAGGVLPESWKSRGSGHRLGGD